MKLTSVRVQCGRCGIVRVAASSLSIVMPDPGVLCPGVGVVVSTCPQCAHVALVPVSERMVGYLVDAGAHATSIPAEAREARPVGPLFTNVDDIVLRAELDNTERLTRWLEDAR